jgi:thiamine monophosphate synthase
VSFPSKRGRRPKNVHAKKEIVQVVSKSVATNVKMENYNFIINGVVVTVSGRAKNVHIGQDSMEVNF